MYVSLDVSGGGAAWELEQRRLAATEDDQARGMFFRGALHVIAFLGGEGAVARCKGVAGVWEINPFQLYSVSRYLRMVSTAARLLAPRQGGFDEVLERMGAQATVDFLASMFGRELLAEAAGSPRLLLESLGDAYRMAVSYGERYPVWTGERSARFIMRRDFMPAAYHEGVLRGALEAVGARDVCVSGRQVALLDSEFELTWR
ncbi:TIGR02265 family protein [Myxococcus sp. K38C18041901]|uniref:TIGR02265 family protein n=1 Tax=Myxococcus guangdongensis TaxID=2906760 RepID=UPI0020A7BEA4|nr:TIGR02265 family protein [Myxococcus guangdongensis]MCP3063146.1 TIGR02265 family protein [Myxococcus guangdongensis]